MARGSGFGLVTGIQDGFSLPRVRW